MDIICGKTSAYIPTSANELISAMEMLNNSMGESIPPKLRMSFKQDLPIRSPNEYDVPILKECMKKIL